MTRKRDINGKLFASRWVLLAYVLLATASCAQQSYYIDTQTRQDAEGNYVIRWDVQPAMDGNVEIYASSDASRYNWQPVITESIRKEITTYSSTQGIPSQTYFLMIFDGRETRVTSSRIIATAGPVNLRDIGGYMTASGLQMRWGMIYRSGDLSRLHESDEPLVTALRIRNHLSLRSIYGEPRRSSSQIPFAKYATIEPDRYVNFNSLLENIYAGESSAEGISYFFEDYFNSIAFENPRQLSSVLHLLIELSHYPILLSDQYGKDRVAFITMLIHSVLGVNRSDIINDYLLSNPLLPVEQLEPKGYFYSARVQEALTEFYRSRPNDLISVMDEIERRYGSIARYLEEVLDFDKEDQAKLRRIMLYD